LATDTAQSAFHPTVIDASSLFDAGEVIAARFGRDKISVGYAKLRETLDDLRKERGWCPSSLNSILLSVDPQSQGQQRFLSMLVNAEYEPHIVHFRDNFVSVPPGRSAEEFFKRDESANRTKTIASLASRIAYIAGLMAHRLDSQILVVSHSYEICGPLADLSRRMKKRAEESESRKMKEGRRMTEESSGSSGKVGLAYFGSLLDYRWRGAGLFEGKEGKLGVEFFDLDPHSEALIGVDLARRENSGSGSQATGFDKY
jgi:hypothetical protein